MEAKRVAGVLKLTAGLHFLPSAPFLVRERVLHLVAVFKHLLRAECLVDPRKLDLAYAREGIYHLLPLELQLPGVCYVLPAATAADTEMPALRLDSHLGLLMQLHNVAFCKTMFLAVYLHVSHIAWSAVGNKYNQLPFCIRRQLRPCNGFSLRCH